MPTQHPVNAAKVSLVGFKSQKLKEIWHMVRSQGLFHFTDREAKPHRGQAPACKEPQCGPGSVQTSTKGSRLHPLSRNPSWWGSRQKSRPHTHTHTHPLPSLSLPPNPGLRNPSSAWTGGWPSLSLSYPRETEHPISPFLGLLRGLADGRLAEEVPSQPEPASPPPGRLQSEISVCLSAPTRLHHVCVCMCVCFLPPPPPPQRASRPARAAASPARLAPSPVVPARLL